MTYKALLIGAALLVAPVAFAQDQAESTQPPQRGERGFMMRIFDRPVPPASQIEGQEGRRPEGVRIIRPGAPTTTPDGRPLPGPRNMGSTTNPGMGWGDRRGEFYEVRPIMSSTTREEMRERREDRREFMTGTTTPPRPPMRALLNRFFSIFGGDERASTTPQGDVMFEVRTEGEASGTSTPPRPPIRAIFERLFNWFQ